MGGAEERAAGDGGAVNLGRRCGWGGSRAWLEGCGAVHRGSGREAGGAAARRAVPITPSPPTPPQRIGCRS
eukprot:3582029-Prymnesium_polylepis.1